MASRYATLRGGADVLRDIDRIQGAVTDGRLIRWFGPKLEAAIVRRTQHGIDLNDRTFTPYSDSYAERKGRRRPVTLAGTARGRGRVDPPVMLSLVKARATSNTSGRVEIRGGGRPDRRIVGAAHHRGEGNNPVRRWFGASPSDRDRLDEDTIDYLEEKMRGRQVGSSAVKVYGSAVRKSGRVWIGDNPD